MVRYWVGSRAARNPTTECLGQPMRAVAIAEDRSLQLVELAEPDLKPDEVRIAVSYCGICGSDLHMRENPAVRAGIVLGHEFTGVITETGPEVTGWKTGDRVAANPF